MQEPGGEHRAGVPRRDDGVGAPLGDRDVRLHERRSRLPADGLGRLLVHLDHLVRLDELEPGGVDPGAAEEDDLDAVGGRLERACDDLVRRAVTTHRIHCDAGHARYGAGVRSGSISRPLYVWHVGQTRCGRLG